MKASITLHSQLSHYMTQQSQDVLFNAVLSWPVTTCLPVPERPLESILDHLVYEGVFRKKSWNEQKFWNTAKNFRMSLQMSREFCQAVGSSAAILCCFWCHSRWVLGIWKIILGVRPLERCSAALLRTMKALIIQFHRSSHYFVSFDSKCCQHFISVVLLLGWATELRFIKRRG